MFLLKIYEQQRNNFYQTWKKKYKICFSRRCPWAHNSSVDSNSHRNNEIGQNILDAINNLETETNSLRLEIIALKETNALLKTQVYELKEYVSTLD